MIAELVALSQGRDSRWPKLRRALIKAHPYCTCCGTRSRLEVHHVLPFHEYPAEELNPENCMVLCRTCHYVFGHLFDWKHINPNVRSDVETWKRRIIGASRLIRA